MNHDIKKLKGIIIHPWNTKRIYSVKHIRTIVIEKYPRTIESDFTIELKYVDDKEDSRIWEINKTEPVIKNIDEKDKSLQLLKTLEAFTYPMKIKVDVCGNFIELVDHSDWVEGWRVKAKKLAREQYDVDGNLDMFQQFYEIIRDSQKFLENKSRESFWKLLFLNFKIAVPLDAGYAGKESFFWDLMQLGKKQLKGKATGYVSDNKFIQHFKCKELLDKEIIKRAIDIYGLKPVYDMYAPSINFTIDTITEEGSRKLISKKAVLNLMIEDQLNYKEEISIVFNNEIA